MVHNLQQKEPLKPECLTTHLVNALIKISILWELEKPVS